MNGILHWRTRLKDVAALLVLAVYLYLAWSAQSGSGIPLDATWARVQHQGVLRVATDPGFRPFADQQGAAVQGYDIDLVRAVAARLGVRAEFVPIGFDGLYDALSSGSADMIAAALPYAPELGYRARFSSFYFDAGQVLVVRAASPLNGPADLRGQRVGVVLGSDADTLARRMADDAGFTLRFVYDEPGAALADLRRGALDAVITDNATALGAVQATPELRLAAALTSEPYVLAVPPDAFQLQTEVNRALDALRAEGFFEELNARWF